MKPKNFLFFALVFLTNSASAQEALDLNKFGTQDDLNAYGLLGVIQLSNRGLTTRPGANTAWTKLSPFDGNRSLAVSVDNHILVSLERLNKFHSEREGYLRLTEIKTSGPADQHRYRVTTFVPKEKQAASDRDSNKDLAMVETTQCLERENDSKKLVVCGQTTSLICQQIFSLMTGNGTTRTVNGYLSREDFRRPAKSLREEGEEPRKNHLPTDKRRACQIQIATMLGPDAGSSVTDECAKYVEGLGRMAMHLGSSEIGSADSILVKNVNAIKWLTGIKAASPREIEARKWILLDGRSLGELGRKMGLDSEAMVQPFSKANSEAIKNLFTRDTIGLENELKLNILAGMAEDCYSFRIYRSDVPRSKRSEPPSGAESVR